MNQYQIDKHKLTIKSFDVRIQDLEKRVAHMKASKRGFMESIVNYEMNCADAEHRVCCGAKPRVLAFGTWECKVSPIGTCVYLDDRDPVHDHCVFCDEPEERK